MDLKKYCFPTLPTKFCYYLISTWTFMSLRFVNSNLNEARIRVRLRLKRDGTRAETRFRLSPKRTSPFKSAEASVQPTAGSRSVRISFSNAGYTMFRGCSVRVLATHSIRQFPLQFPSRASPCSIRFQTHSTCAHFGVQNMGETNAGYIYELIT